MTTGASAYHHQHAGLLRMAVELTTAMQQPFSPEALRQVRVQVARLKGAMLVHARMENDALYPYLMSHPDPEVAERATALFDELGEMYDGFAEFDARYALVDCNERSANEYYSAIRRLLKRLGKRMQREDMELYPLVERAEAAGVRCYADEKALDPSRLSVNEERQRWQEHQVRTVSRPSLRRSMP